MSVKCPFTKNISLAYYIIGDSASIENDQNLSENELEFLDDELFVKTYGLLDKLQCKLCTEVMRPVVKALKKDSAKVVSMHCAHVHYYDFNLNY